MYQRYTDKEVKATQAAGRSTMPSKVRTPRNAEEMREQLHDRATLKALLSDPDGLSNYVDDYIQNSDEVSGQVADMAHREIIKMARNGELEGVTAKAAGRLNLDADPSVRTGQIRSFVQGIDPNKYTNTAPGVQLDKSTELKNYNVGQLFSDIIAHQNGDADLAARKRMNKLIEVRNALGSTVPADGGFLIPEQFRADILSLALQEAIIRPRATVLPMSSLTLNVPTVDESSHVSSVYGGITFGFAAEGAQLTASNPQFGRVELEAGKLYFYTHIPNELVADAPVLNVWLNKRLPGAYAFNEDYYFTVGGGVGEPLGIINAPARVAPFRATTNVIVYEDVVNMVARMLPRSINNAVWIASNETIPQLYNMVKTIEDVAGTENVGGAPIFVQSASGPAPVTLFGRPIFYTEHAPQLGTTGDIGFYDLSEYLVGDRMAMQVKSSEHYRFQNDETALRVIGRVDGRPWLPSAITPKNNGDTLSPYVVLNSATS